VTALSSFLLTAYKKQKTPESVVDAYNAYESVLMGQIESAHTLNDYATLEKLIDEFHAIRSDYGAFIKDIPVLEHKRQLEDEFLKQEEARRKEKEQKEKEQAAARKAQEEKQRAEAAEKQRQEQERLRLEREAAQKLAAENEKRRLAEEARQKELAEETRRKNEEAARQQHARDAEIKRITEQQELAKLRVSVHKMASEREADLAAINDLKQRLLDTQENLRNMACENAALRDNYRKMEKILARHMVAPDPRPENIVTIQSSLLPGFSLINVFNFESLQMISVVMKDLTQDVTSVTVHPFRSVPATQLRQAFNLHRKNGGQMPETELYTEQPSAPTSEMPIAVKRVNLIDDPAWNMAAKNSASGTPLL
jgi:DNA repair exonuclease SbcCD ATPase subunit